MFLKKLEVVGFKSFADKTGIDFSPGITAVVGPNGSGKSNIADSIRWVLGEQSAKNLRGGKMEDIIFAGSETRRSINFCEVSLTLDNSDGHLPVVFDEVTITRRVYRSGESEYLLNKQPCRLKDITELFMDSGMGRESYSIIGQGRIEEMLSTRPEDRRGPFEDAAGIVKYKFRRREAERKLDETAANIVRVDDILSELERQAGPLEREAERAKQFKEYEAELTSLDVALLVRDIELLQERWTEAKRSVGALEEQRGQAAAQLAERDEKLRTARGEFESKSSQAEQIQRQLLEAVEQRQKSQGQLALLQERVKNSDATATDKQAQQSQVTEELVALGGQLESLTDRHRDVVGRLESKSGELEVAAHAADPAERQRLEQHIADLNADLIETHHTAAALRNELKMSEESLSQDDRKRSRLDAEREKWQDEVARLHQEQLELDDRMAQLKTYITELNHRSEEKSQVIREKAKEEAAVVTQINQTHAELASLQSKLDLLRELEEGYDGYALGVKTVLQNAARGRLDGVHGPLATLIHVPKQYEMAVETALAGTLQNIVVETEAHARAAIELLKQRHAGRATFMPLSVIKGRFISANELAKVSMAEGFLGVASDLVETKSEYGQVVKHLLGNVVVAKQLVHANDIARKLEYRVRVVTLEGDVVSPGGVMSGGSHSRKGPGLLGRSREKGDVEQKIKAAKTNRALLEERQAALREEMNDIHDEQQRVLEQIEEHKRELANLDSVRRTSVANTQNANDRLQNVLWEYEQLSTGQSAWQARLATVNQQLLDTDTQLQRIEAELSANRLELQRRDEVFASAQEVLTGLKVEVATLTQEEQLVQQQMVDLGERVRRARQRGRQLALEIEEIGRNRATCEADIAAEEGQVTDLTNAVAALEGQLTLVKQARQYAESAVVEAERAFRSGQQVVTQADEQLHRAQVFAERTDMELDHALTKMGETYQMTYEWAKQNYPQIEDVEQTRRAAEALRRKITALGDVQVGAIDEWSRLSERMTFLQTERLDLAEAQQQLESVIDEIDDEMSKRFLQTFEHIRSEFQVSFRQLFGGGTADLALTAPDDVLNTGIEVTAQPPGKKLQNLNLMSGGERALTAMALLFAILKVRPVPFCVLDEVEAALDEANVNRFAQQVRRFSTDTQFIVITHRRGTMEEADALYGVTMQESGISSLIGVRLADVDADSESA